MQESAVEHQQLYRLILRASQNEDVRFLFHFGVVLLHTLLSPAGAGGFINRDLALVDTDCYLSSHTQLVRISPFHRSLLLEALADGKGASHPLYLLRRAKFRRVLREVEGRC